MKNLLLTYQLKPSSLLPEIEFVIEITDITFNSNGSYRLPCFPKNYEEAVRFDPEIKYTEGGRTYPMYMQKWNDQVIKPLLFRQIGLVPENSRAFIHIQPPHGTYTHNFGYGPFTNTVEVIQETVETEKNLKFPGTQTSKTAFTQRLSDPPFVVMDEFNRLEKYMNAPFEVLNGGEPKRLIKYLLEYASNPIQERRQIPSDQPLVA